MARPATGLVAARAFMDTVVSIDIDGSIDSAVAPALDRAFAWFARVEERCSRFEAESEVARLATIVGQPVPVSAILFEAVDFALAVARASRGAFDPTIGSRMAARGFDVNYRTGRRVDSVDAFAPTASFRDVRIDRRARTITLARPLLLDLGGVAKGLAIDLAARALDAFASFVIDAGGDLFVKGRVAGRRRRVGIRDPRRPESALATIEVTDAAVCTSAGTARPAAIAGEHHLIDPRTGRTPQGLLSATVVAKTATMADALSTATFILGARRGVALLERAGAEGLLVSSTGRRFPTRGLSAFAPQWAEP